jgi:hypothetical protein
MESGVRADNMVSAGCWHGMILQGISSTQKVIPTILSPGKRTFFRDFYTGKSRMIEMNEKLQRLALFSEKKICCGSW